MYYNADLPDSTKDSKLDRMILGFINNITYGVARESDKRNVQKLKSMLKKAEEWKAKYNAKFK